MTLRPLPQCLTCSRFESPLDMPATGQTCAAFPDGIPDTIWWNRADHRQPFDGDHGLRWESRDGAKFPEELLSMAQS